MITSVAVRINPAGDDAFAWRIMGDPPKSRIRVLRSVTIGWKFKDTGANVGQGGRLSLFEGEIPIAIRGILGGPIMILGDVTPIADPQDNVNGFAHFGIGSAFVVSGKRSGSEFAQWRGIKSALEIWAVVEYGDASNTEINIALEWDQEDVSLQEWVALRHQSQITHRGLGIAP